MSSLLSYLPVTVKVTVWICIAHFWILICAMVYVEMEGFTNTDNHIITYEIDLLIHSLSELNVNVSELRKSKDLYEEFLKDYNVKLKNLKYWKVRKEFDDVSKTYVFTLISYTGVGGNGNMILQTWQSQLFYILTMPIGFILYMIMVHQIASELFEVLAYSAVTIFQRPQLVWTVDQRELYEKCKVFLLACSMFVLCIYMFGLIGILTSHSYIQGIYEITNIMFAVTWNNDLFPYKEYKHKGIATLVTFIVFACMLLSYTVLYSMFIMFRYNGWREIKDMLFGEADDELADARTNNDDLEYKEWKESQQPILDLHTETMRRVVQPYQPDYRHSYATTSISSESSSENKEHKRPLRIDTKRHRVQPPQNHSLYQPPDIKISSPTPPANNIIDDPFSEHALSEFSDITNIPPTENH